MRKATAPAWSGAWVAACLLVAGLALAAPAHAASGETPWLGVYTQDLTSELREGMDYNGDGGVLVSGVVSDSPAERAGLTRGDVLISIDARTVDSPAELQDVIGAAAVGRTVAVRVFRDGERRTLTVKLGARPEKIVVKEAEGSEDLEPPVPSEPEKPAAPPGATWMTPDGDILKGLDVVDLPDNVIRIMGGAARGRLGVRIESLNPDLGSYFGVKDGKGVLVLEVLKDTPAEQAGLLAGDVITRVGEKTIANAVDLVTTLRGKEGRIALRVMRHGTPRTIEATLEAARPMRWRVLEGNLGDLGDKKRVEKRIVLRGTERDELRREMDQLKREMEELREELKARED